MNQSLTFWACKLFGFRHMDLWCWAFSDRARSQAPCEFPDIMLDVPSRARQRALHRSRQDASFDYRSKLEAWPPQQEEEHTETSPIAASDKLVPAVLSGTWHKVFREPYSTASKDPRTSGAHIIRYSGAARQQPASDGVWGT